jgi:Tfp pilus assembly protein PilF
MEFLFTAQWASIESLVVILCIGVILSIYAYDAFFFLKQCYIVLFPKKPVAQYNNTSQEENSETIYKDNNTEASPIIWEQVVVDHPVFHTEEQLKEQKEEDEKMEEVIQQDILPNEISEIQSQSETSIHPEEKNLQNITKEEKIEPIIEESIANEGVNEGNKNEENIQTTEVAEIIHYEKDEIRDGVITHEEIDIIIPHEENRIIPENKEENPTEEESRISEEKTTGESGEAIPFQDSQSFPVSKNHTETLYNLIQQIRTNIARGHIADAKALIVTGLALDKKNRDLNIILAELYELDRQFDKAEYIYKDLAEENPNDTQILEKLANILIIQKRYEIALALYQKIVDLSSETEGNLYIMTHLASELGQTEEKYEYAKRYQKKYPNNPDILGLLAQAEIELWYRQDAIQTLIKLKNLTPYNHEITQMIAKLVTEEELANNFGN